MFFPQSYKTKRSNAFRLVALGVVAGVIVLFLMALIFHLSDVMSGDDYLGNLDDVTVKKMGRQKLEEQLLFYDSDSIEILEELVIRPGLDGGDAGYYVKYRGINLMGGLVIDEFYTE